MDEYDRGNEMHDALGEFMSLSRDPSIQCITLVYILLVFISFLVLLYLLFCWSRLREDHDVDEILIEDPELGIRRIIVISHEGRSSQRRIGMVVFAPPTQAQDLPGEEKKQSGLWNNECLICLEDFKGGDECWSIPRCKHVYHGLASTDDSR